MIAVFFMLNLVNMNIWYIKLHRSSQDNILYFAEPFTKWQAWQDMILIANHKKGALVVRWNIIDLNRGQLWHSEETLAERRKRSRGKVRRFLEYLETIQQIVQHKSKVKSVITIINYDKYQWNDTTDSTTDGHQTVQQTDTNKNDKNETEWKKKNPSSAIKSFSPPSAEEVAEYCKSRNSPIDAKYFYELYTASDWIDTNWKPVLSRKWKIITREKHNKWWSAPIPDKEPVSDKEKWELYVRIGRKKYTELFWLEKAAEANKFKNIYWLDSQEWN